MEIKKSPKLTENFKCDKCYYKCSKPNDFLKHLSTRKHLVNANGNNLEIEKVAKNYICKKCNKHYKTNAGLWKHNKICDYKKVDSNNDELVKMLIKENIDFKTIILELVQNNGNIQKQLQELCKHNTNTTIHNINSNNKTFNLQFFLHETCKDAMNMSDFINSVQLSLTDLENVGKLGYSEGLSNIIINQLKDTDIYKRPVHCSDIKRETLYIKDENKWEKSDPKNMKMKKVVKAIEKKNIELISEWIVAHPEYKDCMSHDNATYLQLVMNSVSGDDENVNKVIKQISKEVIIQNKN